MEGRHLTYQLFSMIFYELVDLYKGCCPVLNFGTRLLLSYSIQRREAKLEFIFIYKPLLQLSNLFYSLLYYHTLPALLYCDPSCCPLTASTVIPPILPPNSKVISKSKSGYFSSLKYILLFLSGLAFRYRVPISTFWHLERHVLGVKQFIVLAYTLFTSGFGVPTSNIVA